MGLNISATRTRCGAMPLRNASHFPLISYSRLEKPVTLAPG
jgi:hypothetical protein